MEYVSREMGLGSVLGVSNISFGMPEREHITVSFLTQALRAGLTHPIVNPNLSAIMDAICAFRALSGEDERGEAYIARFAGRKKDEPVRDSRELTLAEAIGRGLKTETRELTRKALETMSELDVVDQLLIPALDRIGEQYERQEIFLPQLISAAGAVCEGFELVRAGLAGKGEHSVSKGKIILATVQGDIHDIGRPAGILPAGARTGLSGSDHPRLPHPVQRLRGGPAAQGGGLRCLERVFPRRATPSGCRTWI